MKINNYIIRLEYLILGFIIITVGYIGYCFSVSDLLSGFSDDSGTYLVMASVFSPFQTPPVNILHSYEYHHLPPGFPFVLALFGASHSVYLSHCIVLIQVLLSVFLYYLFARSLLDPCKAFIVLIMFVCTPIFWVQMLKVMSEYQYILLTITALLLIHRNETNLNKNIMYLIILGIIFSACVLTRSIGISLVIAYFVYIILNPNYNNYRYHISGILAGFLPLLLIWQYLKPDKTHSYLNDLFKFIENKDPLFSLTEKINENIFSLLDGLASNLVLFYIDKNVYMQVLFVIFISVSIVGWMGRLKCIDGLYVLFYLLILLLWPYPYEMDRFIFPIFPFLIFYFFYAIHCYSINSSYSSIPLYSGVVLILLITIPALLHIVNRHNTGENQYGEDITNIVELYELEDEARAISTAIIWNQDLKLFKSLKNKFDENDKLLVIKPQLITYLTNVYAEKLPRIIGERPNRKLLNRWINEINETGATHLMLLTTELYPDVSEIEVLPLISDFVEMIFQMDINTGTDSKKVIAIVKLL